MAYTVVNLLSITFIIIVPAIMRLSFDDVSIPPAPVLQILHLSFRPLQGLFNAIICITLKVHSFRRIHPTINITAALKRLLKGEEAPDCIMSDMIKVQQEVAIRQLQLRRAQDIEEDSVSDVDKDY